MSFLTPISFSAARCISGHGIPLLPSRLIMHNRRVTSLLFARSKSGSARQPSSKPAKPASKPTSPDNQTLRRRSSPKVDSARKASLLLNSLKNSNRAPVAKPVIKPDEGAAPTTQSISANPSSPRSFMKGIQKPEAKGPDEGVTLTIDAKEEATQRRIVLMRRKLLWPGIWTLLALTGTYGTLAYLDVKAGVPSSDGSHLPERTQLPQTWYLTPTIILEGAKAGWNELDNLTIGIVVATFAIHLLKRSPLPIWEKLIHITGEKKWTAFTYPLVNSSWAHATTNMAALVWFLPGVVRYFDGDLFHTAAFLTSVPLITSYLTHLAYRFNLASGLVLNLGASGSIAAAMGVYCVAYANEKLWLPQGLVVRIDAMYWGLLFAASQAWKTARTPKGGNRPAYLVHLASLGLGAAYAYFDRKHHLWIPLVSEISSTQESRTKSGE